MSANDRAAQRIRDIAKNHPVIADKFNAMAVTKRGNAFDWNNGMGAIQPIDMSTLPGLRPAVQPVSNQPTILGTVRDFGFAVASAYANKEIAEAEMKALREQARLELQRAQGEAEAARVRAEAQRNNLAADQYQRALLEAQQAELNLDQWFSANQTTTLGVLALLGLGAWLAFAQ